MWPFTPSVHDHRPAGEEPARARDIMADDSEQRRRFRWTRLLIFYLRSLAVLCFVRGLIEWSRIIGFAEEGDVFLSLPLGAQATSVLLAVLNCIAAVGLWLTSAWGAVLWLIVTLCEVFLPLTFARGLRTVGPGEFIMLGLAAGYVALTWLSARERSH
jgi:Family of unknown function (DUF6163)